MFMLSKINPVWSIVYFFIDVLIEKVGGFKDMKYLWYV